MLGLMQDRPLLVSHFIEHAERWHGDVEVVTKTVEGPLHRYGYADCGLRARKVAQMLARFGTGRGDRVATLAWNTHRHVELWYGISGMGAVCHTINPRLFPEQIIYIVNHAEDKALFFDLTFLPLIEALAGHFKTVEHLVVMTDRAHMPESALDLLCYEDLVEAETGDFDWPNFDENTAAGLCYTSGTTGNPKGVLYSHRSNVLHTLVAMSADALSINAQEVFMPVVPMFHANAWGIPYACCASGAKLVMPGPHMDGASIHGLIDGEQVTMTAAVPTIWMMLLRHLQEHGARVDSLKGVVIGGSAAPESMIEAFEKEYQVEVGHAWGMTEMSPLGTIGSMSAKTALWSYEEQVKLKMKQGRPVYGVDIKITDSQGETLPHDGSTPGHVKVRGPWIARQYFKAEAEAVDPDGFFDTGDIATIDENGFMQITDRSKDVIKSGGEWISSIDLENAAVGHPDVTEAAVIGIVHPKWDERPLMIITVREGASVDKESMCAYLEGKVAKWWLPDDVVTIDEIPHTATGKILKTKLREEFSGFKLSTA